MNLEFRYVAVALLVAVVSASLVLPTFLGGTVFGFALGAATFGTYFYLTRPPSECKELLPGSTSLENACFPAPKIEQDARENARKEGWLVIFNEWTGSKHSFDFVQRADYCRLVKNKLIIRQDRIFGGDSTQVIALDRAVVEIVPADVTKGARFATKHPIKIALPADASVTPHAKQLLGRKNTLYVYAYTRREKERWYYALHAAAVYMHVPTRHSIEAGEKEFRKYMAALVGEIKDRVGTMARDASAPVSPSMQNVATNLKRTPSTGSTDSMSASSEPSRMQRLAFMLTVKSPEVNQSRILRPMQSLSSELQRTATSRTPEPDPTQMVCDLLDIGAELARPQTTTPPPQEMPANASAATGEHLSIDQNENAPKIKADIKGLTVFNLVWGRLFWDMHKDPARIQKFRTKIETNLNKVKRPPFVNDLRVPTLSLGNGVPIIESLEKVYTRQDGIFFECMVHYGGGAGLIVEVDVGYDLASEKVENMTTGTGIKARLLSKAVSYAKSKGVAEKASVTLALKVHLRVCYGKIFVHLAPPPTDRLWWGFIKPPVLDFHIEPPKVGVRMVNTTAIIDFIKARLKVMFCEKYVQPGMDDICISVLEPSTVMPILSEEQWREAEQAARIAQEEAERLAQAGDTGKREPSNMTAASEVSQESVPTTAYKQEKEKEPQQPSSDKPRDSASSEVAKTRLGDIEQDVAAVGGQGPSSPSPPSTVSESSASDAVAGGQRTVTVDGAATVSVSDQPLQSLEESTAASTINDGLSTGDTSQSSVAAPVSRDHVISGRAEVPVESAAFSTGGEASTLAEERPETASASSVAIDSNTNAELDDDTFVSDNLAAAETAPDLSTKESGELNAGELANVGDSPDLERLGTAQYSELETSVEDAIKKAEETPDSAIDNQSGNEEMTLSCTNDSASPKAENSSAPFAAVELPPPSNTDATSQGKATHLLAADPATPPKARPPPPANYTPTDLKKKSPSANTEESIDAKGTPTSPAYKYSGR